MTITDLVAPEAILPALKVNSKKQALQELAARAADLTGQNERSIFEVLLQREKLGTTAVGYGVAIPHGKLPKLEKLFGLFARLERPIDFEAMDGQPVDLVFLLLAPGRRRRRSPEGAGADRAAVARPGRRQEAARLARCPGDLFGAGAAAGERGVSADRRGVQTAWPRSARATDTAPFGCRHRRSRCRPRQIPARHEKHPTPDSAAAC